MNPWQEILELIEQKEVAIAKVSKDTGINPNKMSVWKMRGLTPKHHDMLKLAEWLSRRKKEAQRVALSQTDVASVVLENAAKINVTLSALAELLSASTGESVEQVLRRLEAGTAEQLSELKQRFSGF